MLQKLTVGLILSTGLMIGCDKDAGTPAATQPIVAPMAAVPSAQQLLVAPRTKLELKYAPFTLEVPPGWEIKTI